MVMDQNNMRLAIQFLMGTVHIVFRHISIAIINQYSCQNAFRSSGTTQGTEFAVEQVLNRTSRSKTSAIAKVIHKERHNYLDDVELGVQEQHTTAVEVGFISSSIQWEYCIRCLSILSNKVLMDWVLRYGVGKACQIILLHYIKWQAQKVKFQTGVRMGHKQGTYTMRFRSQFTDQRLFGTDQIQYWWSLFCTRLQWRRNLKR